MPILLDNIIFALQKTGGISVYWSEIIKGLIQHKEKFTSLERPEALLNLQRKNLMLPKNFLQYDTGLPLQIARYLPVRIKTSTSGTVFHSSYYRPVIAQRAATVVTVFDFIYERQCQGLKRLAHRYQKQMALQQASVIICISKNTRNDLFDLYPNISANRVKVVPLAASECFKPLKTEYSHNRRDTVLFVGDRSTYKNFHVAVETVAPLTNKKLLIIGGKTLTSDEQRLLEKKLPERYEHLLNLNNSALNQIYNSAFCLLYPSSYEGFGIPPLEAMQAGCPVVAANNSSLPEVCGNAALLAEESTSDNLIPLLRLLEEEQNWHTYQKLGFKRAATFSWENTFSATLACYREASQYCATDKT